MDKIIGIDLGTTNSCVAVLEGGKPTVIANAEGSRTTPSVVAYARNGEQSVGGKAKRQAVSNPDNTFYSVKRFIGRLAGEVNDEERGRVAYGLRSYGNRLKIDCPARDKSFAPEEVSSQVLRKLAEDAGTYLGEKVTQAVITVPAYFNDAQRQATKDAGTIAGLEVVSTINEPTAAALAFGIGGAEDDGRRILVFDLGGGTFDVSVLEVTNGVFEVLATSGDTNLGGNDFDSAIIEHLAESFKAEHGVDLRQNKAALQRLIEAAETAKIELSTSAEAEVNLPFIASGSDGNPLNFETTVNLACFEELTAHLVDRCRQPVKQALTDANLSPGDLDDVVLVGGSTRMPAIKNLVKELTGKDPNQSVNPDEVVALGAAVQGGVVSGEAKDILLLDVTPLTLGIKTLGDVMSKMIQRNTTIPTRKEKIFSTVKDGQTSIRIQVLQGDREMAKDNKNLGEFILTDIPPAPGGIPQIKVIFDIDANGILNVTAQDEATGEKQSISITGSSILSDEEVDQMLKEAEENAVADKLKREEVDLRNRADSAVRQAERQIVKLWDKLATAEREKVESLAQDLKKALEGEDLDQIRTLQSQLQKALYAAGATLYETGSTP